MKKLLTIAALAACLAPAFAEDVVSDNIVGYQKLSISVGYSMKTPTFKTVGGSGYSLQKVIPTGENIAGSGDVNVQIVGADGDWIGEYWWYTQAGWDVPDGWYDADDALADVTLQPGQGLFVSCEGDEVQFVVAGEVVEDDAQNAIPAGYSISGNSSPVAINIQEFIPVGENIAGSGDVNVQVVGADGDWVGEYWWYTQAGWDVTDGWYDADDALADVTIAPGDALFVSCEAEGVTLSVPSPLD